LLEINENPETRLLEAKWRDVFPGLLRRYIYTI
jgi:hypothetical protein